MDYGDLHKKAIHLVELQQWHDFHYPSELSHPPKPTIAHWFALAKKSLHRHYDEYGCPVTESLDRPPDLPFMLALASCASIILSSISSISQKKIDILDDRQILQDTYGTTLNHNHDRIGEWVSKMDRILFEDYKSRDVRQWAEHTLADVVAKIIDVEKKHPSLIDQCIYIIDDLRLKAERPHPAVRLGHRKVKVPLRHYDTAA